MSEFVDKQDFDSFKEVVESQVSEIRTLASRPPPPSGRPGRDGKDAVVDYRYIERKTEGLVKDLFSGLRFPKDGKDGKDGLSVKGDIGPRGPQGPKGDPGERGPIPDHKWDGTKLSFEKPDGTFDKPVDLQGPPGIGAAPIIGGGSALIVREVFSYMPSGW